MNAQNEKGGEYWEPESASGVKNLKKEMIKAIKASGHGKEDVSGLVRKNVSSVLADKGGESDEVKQVVKEMTEEVLGAAEEVGIGLATTSRKVARGIIMGAHDAGGDTALAAGYAIKYAIRQASVLKGDIGQIAIATFDGVVDAVREVGGNLETATRAVIAGAIESATAIGKKNGKKIRVAEYLQEYISGNHQEIQE